MVKINHVSNYKREKPAADKKKIKNIGCLYLWRRCCNVEAADADFANNDERFLVIADNGAVASELLADEQDNIDDFVVVLKLKLLTGDVVGVDVDNTAGDIFVHVTVYEPLRFNILCIHARQE